MKIFTDIQNIVQGRTGRAAPPARNRAPELETGGKRNPARITQEMREAVRAFQNAESMSEALNIAQIASTVIQRAMELSSRLRNIALDAMATSRLNTGALEEVSAGFRSALQVVPEKYGGLIAPPRLQTGIPVETTPGPRGDAYGADIRRELAALRGTIDNMMGNAPTFEADTRTLQTLLAEKAKELNARIDELSWSQGNAAARFSALMPEGAEAQVVKTTGMIVSDYASAFAAQGNIVNTNVLGS